MTATNCELIESLERACRDSLCGHDMDRLRSLIHPKFTLIGTRVAGPFTLTRDEWLEAVQKRELISIDVDIKDAAVFEQVIVGTVEAKWRVSYLGRPVEDRVLLTDVWVFDESRWQVVRRHSSPMPLSESDTSKTP